jgi:hypothetical protein
MSGSAAQLRPKNSSCVVAEEGDSVALITVQGIKAGMAS